VAKDTLAAEELDRALGEGVALVFNRFKSDVIVGLLVPAVERELSKIDGQKFDACAVEELLHGLAARIECFVGSALLWLKTSGDEDFQLVAEISAMLRAPVCAVAPRLSVCAAGGLATRFWSLRGHERILAARSLFGTNKTFSTDLERNKAVLTQPLVQLHQYPAFVAAVSDVVRAECKRATSKMAAAATKVIEELVADVSMYVRVRPNEACDQATVDFIGPSTYTKPKHGSDFVDALKTVFLRHLPSAASLKRALAANTGELRLSVFEEDNRAKTKRCDLDERITRVRNVVKSLIGTLDIDLNKPLDQKWLCDLQQSKGLPMESDTELMPSPAAAQLPAPRRGLFF